MNLSLWLDNLAAYSLQVMVLVSLAGVLPLIFRLRVPGVLLAYWQTTLALCLALPAIESWKPVLAGSSAMVWVQAGRSGTPVPAGAPGFPIHESVALIIAAGCAARLAWLGIGLYRLRRLRRKAQLLVKPPRVVEEAESQIGVWPEIYLSPAIDSPVTFGLARPAVLLPIRFQFMEAGFQRAIACHELLHVRRRDWGFTLLEEAVRAVFWFHPGLWWLVKRIQLTREQVVDRQVVRLTQARKPYLEALLEIARGRRQPEPVPAAWFLREPHLGVRVASILKEVSVSKTRVLLSLTAIIGSLALAGQTIVRAFPLQAPKEKAATEEVYRAGKGVTPPVVISKVEPKYTQEARDAKVQGKVVIDFEVWPDGKVHNPRIKESLDPGLDQKALEALQQWEFKPGMLKGKPVKVRAIVEVNFRLD